MKNPAARKFVAVLMATISLPAVLPAVWPENGKSLLETARRCYRIFLEEFCR